MEYLGAAIALLVWVLASPGWDLHLERSGRSGTESSDDLGPGGWGSM
jgi:hypothetical protein